MEGNRMGRGRIEGNRMGRGRMGRNMVIRHYVIIIRIGIRNGQVE